MISTDATVESSLLQFERACLSLLQEKYARWEGDISVRLIEEESKELVHALKHENHDAILKEICDLVYVAVGTAVARGYNFSEAFKRVHNSNMSKLDNCTVREDGKILKGANYTPPDLKDCV